MPVRSGVGLVCRLAIASVGRTTTVIDLRTVVDVVADHYIMKDKVDRCSS